jgi:hypothetical protein
MLNDFQSHQQILFDLTANYLEPLEGSYQRLAYLASLRDGQTGRYEHSVLGSVYGVETVSQVINDCHEEVFERLLEMPLDVQGKELRAHLESLPGTFADNVRSCLQAGQQWMPPGAPSYLKELYSANLRVLLEWLQHDKSKAGPDN